jgi:hypothetical protein
MIAGTPRTSSDPLALKRGKLDACIERRNRAELIAGGLAIAFLVGCGAIGLWGSTNLPDRIAALGLILVAAGLGFTLWRLNRHVAAQRRKTPDMSPKAALVGRLRRERDLLRSVSAWYIGPILPGFVLAWGGMFAGGSVGTASVGIIITVAAIAWIARANRRAAAEFDSQLHDIEPAAR